MTGSTEVPFWAGHAARDGLVKGVERAGQMAVGVAESIAATSELDVGRRGVPRLRRGPHAESQRILRGGLNASAVLTHFLGVFGAGLTEPRDALADQGS